jgi:hypothetical protein
MIQNDLVHVWGLDFSLQCCVQGEMDMSKLVGEQVRDRCQYEWSLYANHWRMADKKQKLENEANEKEQT